MTVELAKFMGQEIALEEKLVAAGLGYPLSKEEAVKAYKTMLIPRTDTPENADCEWCFGVGHDFDAGLPCVGCCEPAKPVLDLIASNAELRAERDQLKAENETLLEDAERLDRLDKEGSGYGTHELEGYAWAVDGPFSSVRDAIDCLFDYDAAMTKEQSHG